MEKLVAYFSQRNLIANVTLFGLIAAALMMWPKVGKEEMPEFAFNWIRISIPYPGAVAEEVELFITKPVEEKLKGLSGLQEVRSTSSYGMSSFQITFELNTSNLQERIQEVKDAVDSVPLPRESDDPVYRQFRSAEKAILDVGLHLEDEHILDTQARIKLQKLALAFKDRLLSLREVSGVSEEGYLQPEFQILVDPKKLRENEISMSQIETQVRQQHVRQPLGSMNDRARTDLSLLGELNSIESLHEVYISSGFDGYNIQLSQLAEVQQGFKDSTKITKVSGHEGLFYSIQKSTNVDILSAQKKILSFIDEFQKNNVESGLRFTIMDDKSYDVRNRLSLIASNGLIGFILILITLFIFLDFRAGLWVAMGIPFSLACTLLGAYLFGFTVNTITLASLIIVLGIVVDDAIIVAENISRKEMQDMDSAYVKGTLEVMNPVLASVLTTCAAFIPLYFFSGRFGTFVQYIPTIVFLMLISSLIESFFILPAHMRQKFSPTGYIKRIVESLSHKRSYFLNRMEYSFSTMLEKVLAFRALVLAVFLILLGAAYWVFDTQLSYVLFPREEATDFRMRVKLPEGALRYETAQKIREIEDVFLRDDHKVLVSVRSSIGQSNRGGDTYENEASLSVKIVPRDARDISLNQLFAIWQKEFDQLKGFTEIRMIRTRWGSDSGSSIEIKVQENNDNLRKQVSEALRQELEALPEIDSVEIERPIIKQAYELSVRKQEVARLNVDYQQLATTMRAYLEGVILYTLNSGDEEVYVRFSIHDDNKGNIEELLNLPVANREGYLIPVHHLVDVQLNDKPVSIQRINFKRTNAIYADLKENSEITPLMVATYLEQEVFPRITRGVPSVVFTFDGEVKDSRESQSDFTSSIVMALILILFLLVFLFGSIVMPLLILAIVPFGVVGVVFMFWSHGMQQFGFFAVVGTLGMIGVVINDSIVMVDRLEKHLPDFVQGNQNINAFVASISATRLRAVIITTLTTVVGLLPTAYGVAGYDAMLAEMMLAMAWGLMFGALITLFLTPVLYTFYLQFKYAERANA